jgi:hypothetical protein
VGNKTIYIRNKYAETDRYISRKEFSKSVTG